MGLRLQLQVKWRVWIQQLNTYLIHCCLKWALSPGWKDEGWWTRRPCLISFVIRRSFQTCRIGMTAHIFSHASDKVTAHYGKWWPAWIPAASTIDMPHKRLSAAKLPSQIVLKILALGLAIKSLEIKLTPLLLSNSQGKSSLWQWKSIFKKNKTNKCQTWWLMSNSQRHQKANSNVVCVCVCGRGAV